MLSSVKAGSVCWPNKEEVTRGVSSNSSPSLIAHNSYQRVDWHRNFEYDLPTHPEDKMLSDIKPPQFKGGKANSRTWTTHLTLADYSFSVIAFIIVQLVMGKQIGRRMIITATNFQRTFNRKNVFQRDQNYLHVKDQYTHNYKWNISDISQSKWHDLGFWPKIPNNTKQIANSFFDNMQLRVCLCLFQVSVE